jgi:L-asparaginase
MNEKVLFILTGGTIDAEPYKVTPKNVTPLKYSIIPTVLGESSIITNYEFANFKIADSKDFSKQDLIELAKFIREKGIDKVVIVHGTDHTPENARFLMTQTQLYGGGKKIVFTGAMVPISNQIAGYEKSDGYANLDFAYEKLQTLEAGVYIAFNNKIFNPLYTVKNFTEKRFETVVNPIQTNCLSIS